MGHIIEDTNGKARRATVGLYLTGDIRAFECGELEEEEVIRAAGLERIIEDCPNCEGQCKVNHRPATFQRCSYCDRRVCRCCVREHRRIEREFERECA